VQIEGGQMMFFKKKNPDIDVVQLENEGMPRRDLTGNWELFVCTMGVLMSLFHVYCLIIRPITPWILYCGHIGFGFILTFSIYCGNKRARRDSISLWDLTLMLAGVLCSVYLIVEMNELVYRIGIAPNNMDLLVSVLMICIVLEMTRRTCGNILPYIAIFFLLYTRFGNYIPGLLGHRGYSWSRMLSYMVGMDAIFSIPLGASATMVFLFVVFGAFLNASGSGKFFIDLSLSLSGATRGGPAKVAVLSSSLMGTVSGNSVANVVSTGAFTIPMMTSIGYTPVFAGAVEATASTGGQLMPPILGSAAFIMAQLVGVPYMTIVVASVIPALLYFYTVFLMVDLEAIKHNLSGIPKDRLPVFKHIVLRQGYLLLPLFVLIYVLSVLNASPIRAATWGIITAILVTWVKWSERLTFKGILIALSKGAQSSCSIIASCATAGIVVGALNMTGAGLKLASAIVSLSSGILIFGLILTMMTSIILGMGLPTTASYLICAAVAAPALVQQGVSPIGAHMFVFYFACISAITPPVALAAFAGAGIAKAKPMHVALSACKIGVSAFIIPFMFIYGPALLGEGSSITVITTVFSAIVGTSMLCFAIQKQFFSLVLKIWECVVLGAMSMLLIFPGYLTDTIGFLVCFAVLLFAYKTRQRVGRCREAI